MENRKLSNIELGRIRPDEYASLPESGVVVVLDNVRSAYNVGSIFRTCDAFKVDRLCLCGICACPPSAEIHKTALGAELSVPWEHVPDTLALAGRLKEQGYIILGVEQEEIRPCLRQRGGRGAPGCHRRCRRYPGNPAVRVQAFPECRRFGRRGAMAHDILSLARTLIIILSPALPDI